MLFLDQDYAEFEEKHISIHPDTAQTESSDLSEYSASKKARVQIATTIHDPDVILRSIAMVIKQMGESIPTVSKLSGSNSSLFQENKTGTNNLVASGRNSFSPGL